MIDKTVMTPFGEKSLREELDHLIRIVRPQIVNAMATAREHGDLKENAEYHAAREQQSFTEGRIQDIESKLANSEIVDISKIPPPPQSVATPTSSPPSTQSSQPSLR